MLEGNFKWKPEGVGYPDGEAGHSDNREMYLYHGWANAIRPYNNGIKIIREIQSSIKSVIQYRMIEGYFKWKPEGVG